MANLCLFFARFIFTRPRWLRGSDQLENHISAVANVGRASFSAVALVDEWRGALLQRLRLFDLPPQDATGSVSASKW